MPPCVSFALFHHGVAWSGLWSGMHLKQTVWSSEEKEKEHARHGVREGEGGGNDGMRDMAN